MEARRGLDPLDPPEPVAREAAIWTQDVMLVGHLPFMGRLASRLIAGSEEGEWLGFRPGSLACLEKRPGGGWTLLWMVNPELLPDDPAQGPVGASGRRLEERQSGC